MKSLPTSAASAALICALSLGACSPAGLSARQGLGAQYDGLPAPSGTPKQTQAVDDLLVGDRLMAADEAELALKAYARAALDQGMTLDVLAAIAGANTRLGRLGQAQRYVDAALKQDPDFVPVLNTQGVILLSRGEVGEASRVFQRAYALDNGNSDAIRANLTKALAMLENSSYTISNEPSEFSLVRRGNGTYALLSGV